MASTENEYFLRAILLLAEGGSYISKKVLYREVDKNGGDLDILLKSFERKLRHRLHKKQCEKLFPLLGGTDVQRWDLQMVIWVLKTLFSKSLSQDEREKIQLLLDNRNDILAHSSSACLDQKEYNELRDDLKDAIIGLAFEFAQDIKDTCSQYISKYQSGPLDVKSALENMRMLQDNEAMFQKVLAAIEGLKVYNHMDIQNIEDTLSEFEKKVMAHLNGLNPYAFQKKIKVGVHTKLKLWGPSEKWINLMENTLNDIFNEADKTAQGDFDEIKRTVENFVQEIKSKANFKGSTLECVVLMFECTTYADLQWLLIYFSSSAYRQELKKIATSLDTCFHTDEQVDISSTVTHECLQEIFNELDKEYNEETDLPEENKFPLEKKTDISHGESVDEAEKSKGLQLALECTSLEELRHVWNLFQKGGATEHMNKIADALSEHFEVHVSLKAHLDIDELKAALEETVGHHVFEVQENQQNIDALRERQILDEASRENYGTISAERRDTSLKETQPGRRSDAKSPVETRYPFSKETSSGSDMVETRDPLYKEASLDSDGKSSTERLKHSLKEPQLDSDGKGPVKTREPNSKDGTQPIFRDSNIK